MRRTRLLDSLSANAYGLYLVHYTFVVWLQYVLLTAALFAMVKAAIVFGGTLVLSFITVLTARRALDWRAATSRRNALTESQDALARPTYNTRP